MKCPSYFTPLNRFDGRRRYSSCLMGSSIPSRYEQNKGWWQVPTDVNRTQDSVAVSVLSNRFVLMLRRYWVRPQQRPRGEGTSVVKLSLPPISDRCGSEVRLTTQPAEVFA